MDYKSTRGEPGSVSAAEAIIRGLAPDGGLYVPEAFPQFSAEDIAAMCALGYRERAARVMAPFLGDFTREEVDGLCAAAYGDNFDSQDIAPVRFIDELTGFLELWHGPTSAFKDMALQMLPRLLTASLKKRGVEQGVCILVATSGDTGKAALEGFADVPGTRIMVFYPEGGVSDVQRLQMVTQRGENVRVCAVEGNFDDAQSGVKSIFTDKALAGELAGRGWFLSSANSINWGRLLPQIAYYFSCYCDYVNAGLLICGDAMNFCVPTGNFGNILAGWIAKQMGLPVGKFICASNENNVLTDFIDTGVYDRRREFHLTNSPSMDILVSSNLERLLYFISADAGRVSGWMSQLAGCGRYEVGAEALAAIQRDFAAGFCTGEGACAEIARVWAEHGYLIDTHTAVAGAVLAAYRCGTGDDTPAAAVSTASPYKFCSSVLASIGVNSAAPGNELIARLEKETGTRAPAPLANLDARAVRFTGCVKPEAMRAEVEDFLCRG